MSRGAFFWHARPGLAGGIDQNGSRAEELLGIGFGSVEFGTVAAHPDAPFGLAALTERLATLAPRPPGATAIGIGIGVPPQAQPGDLPAFWRAGFVGASQVADYVSFNLTARAYQPLLDCAYLPLIGRALAAVAAARERVSRRVPVALKFPLGKVGEPFPAVAEAAAQAGFDILTAVLPEGGERLARLSEFTAHVANRSAVVAVGGFRSAADIAAAHTAGAAGVQVHRAFAEHGAACLPALLGARGA